jgi:nucleotide-binding universal stress UspA family protein
MYPRILVPLDGSPTAERGLQEALALAQALGSTLVVLHVVDLYPGALEMATPEAWQRVFDDLRDYGQQVVGRARDAAAQRGVAAETHVVEALAARVADLILHKAEELKCDLIVMGTHGRRGIDRVLLGSDAERVLRESRWPILLLRLSDSP